MIKALIEHFTYLGILGVLFVSGLGVPIPEELPIATAAVLSHARLLRWWVALPVYVVGVLSGDAVLYWGGRRWGERVLNHRVVRFVLSPEREDRLKAAYRRHAAKTVFTARHVMGLRAAAFLTAGIAHVPFWRVLVADAFAATLGVPVGFGLAYFFTDQLKTTLADVRRLQHWLGLFAILGIAAMLVVSVRRQARRHVSH